MSGPARSKTPPKTPYAARVSALPASRWLVRRAGLGAAARALVEANRGAKIKTLEIIDGLLPGDGPGRAVVRPFRPVR